MTLLNRRALCVFGLLSALSVTAKEDSCIVRMSGGKMQRFGSCQEVDKSYVVGDMRFKVRAENNQRLVYDACRTSTLGGCFWTVKIKEFKTNYTRANETCASYGSVLAVIPDQKDYDAITKNMRRKLTKKWAAIGCWLGMTYNVTTGEIHPPGAYNETWSRKLQSFDTSDTYLLVRIRRNRSPEEEGLFNRKKSYERGGAICWKPKT